MDATGQVMLEAFARERGLELTRFAFLVAGDRGSAEDLVQDVLLAMHRRFGAVLTLEDPLVYARRAVVNAHIDSLRRRRLLEFPSERLPEREAGPTRPEEFDGAVWGALTSLAPRPRAVLVLRYYLGYGDREIADLLGCREGSVRSIAARAFAALRPVLRPCDIAGMATS